jgi:hypothetical protein
MNWNWKHILISVLVGSLLMLIIVLMIGGCQKPELKYLPSNISNLDNAGNGWSTFTFENNKYLYYCDSKGNNRCLANIYNNNNNNLIKTKKGD